MPEARQEHDLRALLEEHHDQAYGWALSCCRWDVSLAEDVLQSAYLKVLDGRAVFGGRSSFRTWLFEVIRRTAAGQWRRKRLRAAVSLEVLVERLRAPEPGPEERLVSTERTRRLMAALRELPKRQREVLHLVFYCGLTIREATEVLGITIGSGRTHYERGKRRLRDILKEEKE